MSSSSDSESDTAQNFENTISRLGECEVCGEKEAKYTCPKCEVKTCCLRCVGIHKKELECDGTRDRTKFIKVQEFTDTDLLSDYRLLEECSRFVYSLKRDERKRFTRLDKDLPIHLYKLKMAARARGIVLQFLSQNFSRNKVNTTRYNYKSNVIHWRVEWVFPNAEPQPVKFVDEKCSEQTSVAELLTKYMDPDVPAFEGSKALVYYQSVGLNGVKVLLRAEKVKSSAKKFFEIDPSESLAENLCGKVIVEFPIIFIVFKDHAYNFDIVTPEDEFNYEADKELLNKNNNANNSDNKKLTSNGNTVTTKSQNGHHNHENWQTNILSQKRKRPLLTEKIALEKKIELEKELKEEKKKRPKNLLFTTGYSSDESFGVSDEEEQA